MSPRRRSVGLRREVVILLPAALFLLVLLSVFTLFAYRSGVSLLLEERRGEALLLAHRVAAEAAAGPLAPQDLRRLAPTARGIAVLDAGGRTVARTGDLPEGGVLAPLDRTGPDGDASRTPEARAVGPDRVLGEVVAAFAPVAAPEGRAGWVRLDLGAPGLAFQLRGLSVLTWLVLGVDAALVVLVVLFLGRLLAPWDTLLERARRAGETPPETEDEVAFLVGTFERALEALARPREEGESPEDHHRARQALLAESLRQLGELAAGVAHELRNSLATLKGYLTLIERADGGGAPGPAGDREAVAEYVGELRREADHLQRVLEDFLSFARPGTARLEEVDLHQVLARAAADPVLTGARVRLSPAPGPPDGRALTLSGDPQLLERAFRNLLHNAAEATREAAGAGAGPGPEVEVSAAATSEGVEVAVADRGAGLPDEVKERLFQPFASGRPGGVGLGLALARRIVVLHGGSLELQDRPGGGTVARVRLPTGEIVTEGNDPGLPEVPREPEPASGS